MAASIETAARNEPMMPDENASDDSSQDEEPLGMADALMARGSYMRQLRLMEQADAEEREASTPNEATSDDAKDRIDTLSNGKRVLRYDSYLKHQRYYDDLKHVDCDYIDYGLVEGTEDDHAGRLIVEQDKSLGKGGLCWDAAFILGEYVVSHWRDWRTKEKSKIVELGSGTGLCGLMVAKALRDCQVDITDLPELLDLMNRNIAMNFDSGDAVETDQDIQRELYGHDGLDDVKRASGTVSAFVLRWGEEQDYRTAPHDVILGADVVASLYDPCALAQTIHALCHDQSKVYISYKGRLTRPHEQFEEELNRLFESVMRIKPFSRNRNPLVYILVATGMRAKSQTS